jgi:hypothetical protein
MKMNQILFIILSLTSFLFIGFQAKATPAGLTYQGRLIKNNLPVDSATVTLTIKVTSPGANECLLYEENHHLNMVSSDGIFTVKIGSGTRTMNDKGLTLTQVFSNTGGVIPSLTCAGGVTSYTSASADSRNVYATFNDGIDTVAFSSPYVIQSVPYAIEAERLAGKASSDFLQVTGDSTQAKLNDVMLPSAYAELLALINGTSTQYAKTASGSFSSDVSLNSHKITGLSAPAAATDAANKQYVDGFVGGKSADTATLTALVAGDSGKVLSWSGTQWTASAPAGDGTKLPLAGGTMAGNIAMGSNNITGSGYITQNPGKYFQIGAYDDTSEAALAGTLLPTHQGATWYNSTSNELKYWSGTQVKKMSTTVGVSAPLASTGGVTPTLSIAKSDASTNGYLAAADFTTFNNKQSTALTNAHLWVGNGSGVASDVAVSGDASLANTGALTVTGIRGKTVSSTLPSATGQVLRYDGTSSYIPAFLSLADIRSTITPGNTMYPATSCTAGQTMTWSSLTDTMICSTIAIGDAQITYASQTANKFLASPSGSSGSPSYRAIASSDVPTLNQSTTGTASNVTGVVAIANGGTGGAGTTSAQTGTSYTTVLGDAGNMITMNNASASTLTIPPNSSVAYPLGTILCAQQIGAGVVTLNQGAGVTFMDTCSTPTAPIFAAQYATLCLMQTVINTWAVVGNCQ